MNTMSTPNTSTDMPPELWNPNAAAYWSILFTPAFGAYLHARNAEILGRTDEVRSNMAWFYVNIGYLFFVFVSVFIPAIPDSVFRAASIGLLVGWYSSLGKNQIKHVKDMWQDRYQRKPWFKPLIIAFACLIVCIAAIIILGVVAESIFGIV